MNSNKPIKEIMVTDLRTVGPDSVDAEIQDLFENFDFHHIPVVSAGRKLEGIITRGDLQKAKMLNKTSGHLKANEIMTTDPLTVDSDDSIGLAADIFLANKFHALPIVEDKQLVGIITTHDLLKFAFKS